MACLADGDPHGQGRREALQTGLSGASAAWAALGGGAAGGLLAARPARALGTIPETAGLTRVAAQAVLRVTDTDAVVAFFTKGLFMSVLRQTKSADGTLTTTIGFGSDELAVPKDFVAGISSFKDYGAHFTLQLVEPPEAEKPQEGYEFGPSFAYLAMGVPFYRISKLMEAGGEIVSAYGFTVVNAPGGLPCQVVLGDELRDPFMFAAYRVKDLKASEQFYGDTLGMKKCEYPRARPALVSSFEPPQPPKSSYLSFSDDTFGVLLLPKSSGTWSKGLKPADIRPVSERGREAWGGLRIVDGAGALATPGNRAVASLIEEGEPDGNGIEFVDIQTFEAEIS